MELEDLFTYAGLVHNPALVVLAALSAMRDSELQDLRAGCVEFHDGCWALRSTIQKHQRQPQPGVWWVTPIAVHAVGVLEDLVQPIDVFVADPATGERVPSDHLICTLGRGAHSRAGLAHGSRPFERFTAWIDGHAQEFGFDPIDTSISAHQFRRTFAVIAAWQPDGHIASSSSKTPPRSRPATTPTTTRKWFEAYELAKAEALASRIRSYAVDDVAPELAGPAGESFATNVLAAVNAANSAGLDPVAAIDAQEQAAMAVAGLHACGDGWDCADVRRHARCLAVQAAKDDEPFPTGLPQLASGLCFDLGGAPERACRNVILDPPAHLAFWDIEAARLETPHRRNRRRPTAAAMPPAAGTGRRTCLDRRYGTSVPPSTLAAAPTVRGGTPPTARTAHRRPTRTRHRRHLPTPHRHPGTAHHLAGLPWPPR
jgi:hypothetical protein